MLRKLKGHDSIRYYTLSYNVSISRYCFNSVVVINNENIQNIRFFCVILNLYQINNVLFNTSPLQTLFFVIN